MRIIANTSKLKKNCQKSKKFSFMKQQQNKILLELFKGLKCHNKWRGRWWWFYTAKRYVEESEIFWKKNPLMPVRGGGGARGAPANGVPVHGAAVRMGPAKREAIFCALYKTPWDPRRVPLFDSEARIEWHCLLQHGPSEPQRTFSSALDSQPLVLYLYTAYIYDIP